MIQVRKPKFSIGDRVSVRCVEAGCPPQFEATVIVIKAYTAGSRNSLHDHEYSLLEDDGSITDGYTESWLAPVLSQKPLLDRSVSYRDDAETRQAVYNRVLAFFHEHESYNGESICQSDAVNIKAPELLSQIAEIDMAFKIVATDAD